MAATEDRLKQWIGKAVVVDCSSLFVIIGTLADVMPSYVELSDADVHDLRDSDTTRENYVVKTAQHGIQPNRARLVVRMDEIVAVSLLEDVNSG